MKKDFAFKNSNFCQAQTVLCLILAFGFYLLPAVSAAHRYHTSLTRMDYNAEKKTVEVSVQLFTHDLVPTLQKLYKADVNLDKKDESDKYIQDYLGKHFVLEDKNGKTGKIKWVGKETGVDFTYVYFEIPLETSLDGSKLKNTIFFESFAEQTNLIICRYEGKKADLLFKVGDSQKEIKTAGVGVGS